MERKSFLQIVEYIEEFANAHDQIRKVGFDFYEQIDNVLTKSEKYPAFFIVPLPSTFETNEEGANLNTFNLDVYCLDIIQKDRNNIKEIISDTALMLNDLLLFFNEGQDWSFEAEKVGNVDPINNSLLDYAAGNKMTLAVTVSGYSVCEIPMGEIVSFTPVCEPSTYKVEDQNGTELEAGEIAAGAYKLIIINVGDCEPATAVLKTVGGTILDSVVIPSGESGDVVAPNVSYSIKDTSGLELYGGQTESGGTLNETIEDATIKNTDNSVSIALKAEEVKEAPDVTVFLVNSLGTLLSETIVPSLKDIEAEAPNINFIDSNGVSSSVAAGVDITATPATPPSGSTAMLLKSGYTTAGVPYDDAYYQDGRLLNRATLSESIGQRIGSTNPLLTSNVNRFTDLLFGQTYATKVALDWSTADPAAETVIGYYTLLLDDNNSWTSAQSLAHGKTFDGRNDWRVVNDQVLWNLRNAGAAVSVLNFAPFSITSNLNIWTSTGAPRNSANALYMSVLTGDLGSVAKTTNGPRYMIYRIYTFSELGL